MKIIHTADWHIGQTFFDYDRKVEHAHFLAWLREQIREQQVDLLLIAGDVFDNPNPSAEAQRIYYNFLREVSQENPKLQIIIIAGNHDSAARLEAPNALLETMNITVRGVVKRVEGTIDLKHLLVPLQGGGVCLAVPFLRQGDYPEAASYAEGVRNIYQSLMELVSDEKGPIVAMGHLQATGSEISQEDRAERTIIGGVEGVMPEAFSERIAYAALGHLHRAQRVSGREWLRYAGAPLPMSFAERNNKQGVTLVTLGEERTIERLEYDTPVKLISIPAKAAPLEEVLQEIAALPNGEVTSFSPYLEIKVTIDKPEPTLRAEIEQALVGKAVRLARLSANSQRKEMTAKLMSYEELKRLNPMEMANEIFVSKFGGEKMPEEMQACLQQVIKEVEL